MAGLMPWAALPFVAQGALILADESFHRERGLPAWERWGHPVDTFMMAACYAMALSAPRTAAGLAVYAAAAGLSCLCVTKDEWVHARHCRGAENWLHALLFLLHPVLLALAGLWAFGSPSSLPDGFAGGEGFGAFLRIQAGLTIGFGVWQIAYWNGPWGRARPVRPKDRDAGDGAPGERAQGRRNPGSGERRPWAGEAAGARHGGGEGNADRPARAHRGSEAA